MKLETHKKQIEIVLFAIPIFLFFVYLFIWDKSLVFVYYYLIVLFMSIFFSYKAIKLIIKEEKLDFNRLLKFYFIIFLLYILLLASTLVFHYVRLLNEIVGYF